MPSRAEHFPPSQPISDTETLAACASVPSRSDLIDAHESWLANLSNNPAPEPPAPSIENSSMRRSKRKARIWSTMSSYKVFFQSSRQKRGSMSAVVQKEMHEFICPATG